MTKTDVGVYGLGVMGANLALNISNYFSVSTYNYEDEVSKSFRKNNDSDKIHVYYELEQFITSLSSPRKIILMVTAGSIVDQVIETLIPLIDKDDILIDCGNSYFEDTRNREEKLKILGIHYLGIGISGGELGALTGPCIMPSGNKDAYNRVKPIFESIAAKTKDNEVCCNYIGTSGSGHYVKMVHNGIEYADLQLICEIYSFMKDVLKLSINEIQNIFEFWNSTELESYLIEITSKILKQKDLESDEYLVDKILDVASQKGTGLSTAIEGMKISIPIPTITESVIARYLSNCKNQRIIGNELFKFDLNEPINSNANLIEIMKDALYLSKVISYAQGFELLRGANKTYDWEIDFGKLALIWREGCIIRAHFLNDIKDGFNNSNEINLLFTEKFSKIVIEKQQSLRDLVILMAKHGIYSPALSSSLNYLDGIRCANSSANLLQAQRDYFGSHTYQRVDMDGYFHTEWNK